MNIMSHFFCKKMCKAYFSAKAQCQNSHPSRLPDILLWWKKKKKFQKCPHYWNLKHVATSCIQEGRLSTSGIWVGQFNGWLWFLVQVMARRSFVLAAKASRESCAAPVAKNLKKNMVCWAQVTPKAADMYWEGEFQPLLSQKLEYNFEYGRILTAMEKNFSGPQRSQDHQTIQS